MSKLNWLDELFAPEIDAERCHRKRDEKNEGGHQEVQANDKEENQ